MHGLKQKVKGRGRHRNYGQKRGPTGHNHGHPTISLRQASSLVSGLLQKEVDRVSDAERMMRQLVAMAKAKGLIHQIPTGNNHTVVLKFIWRTLSGDPEIAPGTTNVVGLVGPHNALIVLDRIIASDVQT
jgi:hypothetical protein